MRLFSKLFISLFALMIMGCTAQTDEVYIPSIAALGPNETLVMKYSACHSGCDKGVVKFKNNTAMMRGHTLELTPEEIKDLDLHFLLADNLEKDYFCSLRIMIGFKKQRSLRLPIRKKPQLYPCFVGIRNNTTAPGNLVFHFNENPNETPYWRLPSEEQTLILED